MIRILCAACLLAAAAHADEPPPPSVDARALAATIESKKFWKTLGDREMWTPRELHYVLEDFSEASVAKALEGVEMEVLRTSEAVLIGTDRLADVVVRAHWQFRSEGGKLLSVIVRIHRDEESAQGPAERAQQLAEMLGGGSQEGGKTVIVSYPGTALAFAGRVEAKVSILDDRDTDLVRSALALVSAFAAEKKAVEKNDAKKEREAGAEKVGKGG